MGRSLLLTLVAAAGTATAQAPWPEAVAHNEPAASLSTRAIRLPDDLRIGWAAAHTAGLRSAWAGGWRGWACRGFECDVGLVVEEIRGDEASLVLALAAGGGLDLSQRLRGRFVGNELEAQLADGTSVRFRQRPDRHLDFLWRRQNDWVAGVLTKDDSDAEQRQRAARTWLARDAFDVNIALPAQTYTVRVRPTRRSSDFLGDAADQCLYTKVPTRLFYAEPYLVMEFQPTLQGCSFIVQYRAHPVTGKTWAFRSEDAGSTWRQFAAKADIRLQR